MDYNSGTTQPRKPMKKSAANIAKHYLRPGFLLRRANQISVSMFAEECNDIMTGPQFSALLLVSWLPGIDQIGVSRILGFDRSTAALVITNLLKQEFILRKQDEHDRRRYHLEITQPGLDMIEVIKPKASNAHKRLLAGFSKAEISTLTSLLNRLVLAHNDATRAPIEDDALPLTHIRLRKKSKNKNTD